MAFKHGLGFFFCLILKVQRVGYDAFDEQVDVSARYRVHVGHAYLSFTVVRFVRDQHGTCRECLSVV